MKRREIRKVLKRHHGAVSEVARRAGVKSNAVSMWLGGGTNANVAGHAEAYAKELILKEEADRIAKGEANGPSVRAKLEDLRKSNSGAE